MRGVGIGRTRQEGALTIAPNEGERAVAEFRREAGHCVRPTCSHISTFHHKMRFRLVFSQSYKDSQRYWKGTFASPVHIHEPVSQLVLNPLFEHLPQTSPSFFFSATQTVECRTSGQLEIAPSEAQTAVSFPRNVEPETDHPHSTRHFPKPVMEFSVVRVFNPLALPAVPPVQPSGHL